MRNPLLSRCVTVAAALVLAAAANAQDLVITNGRILDGTGQVIERGSVVVRDGKIVSVSAGAPSRERRAHDRRGRQDRDAGIDRRASPHRSRRRCAVARDARTAAAPGVPRRGLHDRALRDRSAAGDRGAQANQAGQMKGPRLYVGAFLPLAGATGGGGGGPARSGAHRSRARPDARRRPLPRSRATRRSRPSKPPPRRATTI